VTFRCTDAHLTRALALVRDNLDAWIGFVEQTSDDGTGDVARTPRDAVNFSAEIRSDVAILAGLVEAEDG